MTMAAVAVDDEDDDGDGDNEDDEAAAAALAVLTRTVDGLSAESKVVGVLARPSTIDDAEFSSIKHVT